MDMRRLLTDYNFRGFPLRKDFPLSGYFEVFFSSLYSKIIYKIIKFSKAYLMYTFDTLKNEDIGFLLQNKLT